MNRILIEPMLFGDYCVAVYDDRNELLLDKKYFTSGLFSASIVASELTQRPKWKNLPIYIHSIKGNREILLKDYDPKD